MSISGVVIKGCVMRVVLVAVLVQLECIREQRMSVTDIDYKVYSDAAEYGSPYERHTYRYSPLVAYMMTWNYSVYQGIGKFIFVVWDGLAILMLFKCTSSLSVARLYAYNPLFIYLTLRGSCEAITLALLYAFTYYMQIAISQIHPHPPHLNTSHESITLLKKKPKLLVSAKTNVFNKEVVIAALIYGFWVHVRIYPIIILPWIMLKYYRKVPFNQFLTFLTAFGLISGGVFVVLSLCFYWMYGLAFVQETYLYHLKRLDHRHSFSPLFYEIYLNYASVNTMTRSLPLLYGLFVVSRSKVPLRMAVLLLTYVFVSFNKVITMQYFMWIGGGLLMTLPDSTLYQDRKIRTAFVYALHYFLPILGWVWLSIHLEAKGEDSFRYMWMLCIAKLYSDLWVVHSYLKTIPPKNIKEK